MSRVTDGDSSLTPGVAPRGEATVLPFPTTALPAAAGEGEGEGEEEFTALFKRMYLPLCAYAEGFVSADVAEDLVQTTLVAIWRQYIRKGKLRESADTLAYRAVTFQISNWRRGRFREATRLGDYLREMPGRVRRWVNPDARLDERELVQVIDAAVAEMTPRCRQVFLLRREGGLSMKRIAELDGVSERTIKSLMNTAQITLREHLERAGFSPSAVRSRGLQRRRRIQ